MKAMLAALLILGSVALLCSALAPGGVPIARGPRLARFRDGLAWVSRA